MGQHGTPPVPGCWQRGSTPSPRSWQEKLRHPATQTRVGRRIWKSREREGEGCSSADVGCGSKPLLRVPHAGVTPHPDGLAPLLLPFPWPQGMAAPLQAEGWIQDPSAGPFPSHHHRPRPPLQQSPAAEDVVHPSQIRHPGIKHPPQHPALPGEPRGCASPPGRSRHALAPQCHLSSIKRHGSMLLPGPLARLVPPQASRHGSRVPLSSAGGFLAGSWIGAGTLLSGVHCPGSGTPGTKQRQVGSEGRGLPSPPAPPASAVGLGSACWGALGGQRALGGKFPCVLGCPAQVVSGAAL